LRVVSPLRPTIPDDNDDDRHCPTARELAAMFGAAVVLRVAIFLIVYHAFDVSLPQYVAKGDGTSYLAVANAMLGDARGVSDYDRRVFPGYPALIALASAAGAPPAWAALGIDWLSAGAVAALAALVFRDRRVGWAAVMLVPHWVINSSLAMSEAPLLALSLLGLFFTLRRPAPLLAGVLFGLGGLVRPMACFAAAGAVVAFAVARRRRAALFTAALAFAVVMAGFGAMHLWTGDGLFAAREYSNNPGAYGGGRVIDWPFKSLLLTPASRGASWGKVVYIYAHVAVTFAACGMLALRWIRARRNRVAPDSRDAVALPWLTGNTAFVLCVGSYWGFEHFPRFGIPAMPALFWAVRRFLPDRWYLWAALLAAMFCFGALGVRHSP
jgi:hypothetical protein